MTYGIHPALLTRLKSSEDYLCDVLKHGVEENYHIRVMVIGNAGVGKTTLTRRLIQLPVNVGIYNSTNGIDVHINTCDVELDSGIWRKFFRIYYSYEILNYDLQAYVLKYSILETIYISSTVKP